MSLIPNVAADDQGSLGGYKTGTPLPPNTPVLPLSPNVTSVRGSHRLQVFWFYQRSLARPRGRIDKLGVTGSSPVPPIKKGPHNGPFALTPLKFSRSPSCAEDDTAQASARRP